MTAREVAWPDPDRLVAMIHDRFEFLRTDHGFATVGDRETGSVVVAYDMVFMQVQTRIEVVADDALTLSVTCIWPDQVQDPADPPPSIPLAEIIAMRAPGFEFPRDLSSGPIAYESIARSAVLLKDLAIDVLSGGGFGLMSDFVDWKRAQGDLGVGRWWGAPIYAELAESTRPRTAKEVERDLDWQPIHVMVHRDPESAWADVLAFINRHPATDEATMLIEDLMFEHGDAFIDRIHSRAQSNDAFRMTVEATHLGGIAGAAIDRFEGLQQEIRKNG